MNIVTFLLLGASVCCVYGSMVSGDDAKEFMIKTNRIPKSKSEIIPGKRTATGCEECEAVLTKIENILQSPEDLDNVKKHLEQLCMKLDFLVNGPECVDSVDKNFAGIQRYLLQILQNKAKVCSDINLCQEPSKEISSSKQFFVKLIHSNAISIKQGSGVSGALCEQCKVIVNEVAKLLSNNATQADIKTRVCKMVGKYIKNCDAKMDLILPMIITKLQNMMENPAEVCHDMSMCPASSLHHGYRHPVERFFTRTRSNAQVQFDGNFAADQFPQLRMAATIVPRLRTNVGASVKCLMCEAGFNTIIDMFRNSQATRDAIVHDVQAICKKVLPVETSDQCVAFLDLYGSTAVYMAIEQISAHAICKELDACDSIERTIMMSQPRSVIKNAECQACQFALDYAQVALKTPGTEQELVRLVGKVCDAIPEQYNNTRLSCSSGVQVYVPPYVYQLAVIMEPLAICKNLKAC